MLIWAEKGRVHHREIRETLPRIVEISLDTAYKFMATYHREDECARIFVKGVPDVLLSRGSDILGGVGFAAA
ncbi:hypothetical protein KTQ42_22855 [Noviherbaspirillum sp. L7-7A]|nr:hypothetical protein [Noviherbaspirillum sp. L7-7A]